MVSYTNSIIKNSVCLIFNGKRKSGKDYTVNKLSQLLTQENIPHLVIHISVPIKNQYAKQHSLNFAELLTSSSYKEQYRAQMVQWMEQQIQIDPYLFCRTALNESLKSWPTPGPVLVIVADARRLADLEFFTHKFGRSKCLLIKIQAPLSIRIERGWQYVHGIDNATTECGLDEIQDWDIVLDNDGDQDKFSATIHSMVSQARQMLICP